MSDPKDVWIEEEKPSTWLGGFFTGLAVTPWLIAILVFLWASSMPGDSGAGYVIIGLWSLFGIPAIVWSVVFFLLAWKYEN